MDAGQARNRESAAADWLGAGGEMGRLIRSKDWSQTAVGPPEGWPRSLKTALGIMLHSRYQMFVWWGEELIYFYNDAYIPVLGKRHPWALGQSPRKVWPEIWDTVGPQAEIVLNEGRATWNEQLELIMECNGYTEETFFTFSYSPIPDDKGRVAGVYCACTEETHRVLGERRLGVLRHLASATADSQSVEDTCEVAARTLEEHSRDASFALIYFVSRSGGQARLVASCGVATGGELAPHWVELSEAARPAHFWPFMEAHSGHAVVVRALQGYGLPGGQWPEPAKTAVVLPLTKSGQEEQPAGFLIIGASPRREFDNQYQGFFELVAGSIASAISRARSYEEERTRAEALADMDRAKTRRETEQTLRDSELRFRTMADTAPAMLWVTDAAGECTFLSRGWYEFTGVTEISGPGGSWKDTTHPDDRAQERLTFVTAASKHQPFSVDYRLRRSDGEYRWVIDSARPRFSASGEFLGYIGSVIDITERKQYEVALKEADRRKDEFLATLAHELRNPLAPILNAVEILKAKGPPARELQWSQDIIARQVKHMARLLDDLLDVSRITMDKLELRPERVDLETVIQSALEASRPLISQRGQDLKVSLPPHPVYLNADPTRLSQVFLNLLDNAAKFTRQGGQIWLTTEVVRSSRQGEEISPDAPTSSSTSFQSGESHVIVRVRDSGIGIPTEMLSQIFDMFTQVARSVERSYGGLGLGLTLVKRLVELHGGSVEARSDVSGSEFTVRLPALDSPESPEDLVESAQRKAAVTKPRSRRVLVVDDNPDAVETLSILLQLRHNDVLTAVDGLEAVEAAAAFQPDLILLDIGLPKLNGYDAARRIREQRQDQRLVIVAMTGWGQEEDKRKSKEAGFDQHLVKPVDPSLLEELLASAPILD